MDKIDSVFNSEASGATPPKDLLSTNPNMRRLLQVTSRNMNSGRETFHFSLIHSHRSVYFKAIYVFYTLDRQRNDSNVRCSDRSGRTRLTKQVFALVFALALFEKLRCVDQSFVIDRGQRRTGVLKNSNNIVNRKPTWPEFTKHGAF